MLLTHICVHVHVCMCVYVCTCVCGQTRARSNRPLFYQRFFYDAQREKFRSDAVSLHCVCNQPFNPDYKMIICSMCGEKCVHTIFSVPFSPLLQSRASTVLTSYLRICCVGIICAYVTVIALRRYHPVCIGLDPDEIDEGHRFLCSQECRTRDRPQRVNLAGPHR